MSEMDLRLNCTRCGSFEEYEVEKKTSDGGQIVRCEECGKRHSDDSVHFIDPDRRYQRDEAGNLLEDVL